MLLHDNIRLFRQAKNWTQEDIACRLNMSPNGYGGIERGETDVNLSRLAQIADLFEIQLSELFGFDGKNTLNFGANNSGTQTQHNNQNNCTIGACTPDYVELKIEFEKQQVLVEQQTKQIELLNEMIALMKSNNSEK
jgi:transcriptional regulator with XRE-family HTH domain